MNVVWLKEVHSPHGYCNNPHRGHDIPHSTCASCIEAETSDMEDVTAHTDVVTAHIEAAKAHIEDEIDLIDYAVAQIAPAQHS